MTEPPDREGRAPGLEAWTWIAYALALATAVLFLYLGVRPGGIGPIVAYTAGRTVLFLAGSVVLLTGLAWSAFRRPVLQRGRLVAFLSLGGSLFVCSFPLAYPSSHEKHPSPTRLRLPIQGDWVVRWGGSRGEQNPLILLPDRRFGFDLVRCDAGGQSYVEEAGGRRYLCDGEPVFAPAAGQIVRVEDGEPERGVEPYGNLVVLQSAAGEFVFLAGLATGSIRVAAGDHVEPGALLARVGDSAASPVTPEPHLAIWLQDTAQTRRGEGIPALFHDYLAGDRPVAKGVPTGGLGAGGRHTGQRVRPASVPGDG